ncbi:hypothetical protein CGRA01v4_05570 [Colletotrichum graminicola]|uniref:Uncharacterized protein n=1 Tax=Colletotrichum graminicola (strain M1.001 / M2 / FGSC 10212) TaxID=645133 RepID=E3Q6I1_COLGM|nr:uncharacterized protein GLRG_01573 [Colletotrichum graminicola M1.001]EFQ26429.1 hypothetical protein GLRG_01573 [Colletotrichum graminicola M1.001]WDK14289.1 hypothetical protein CGRA01v4_05570 [Colletotrichum graminicola]
MMGHYLFETTDPVVELLWNIAIACFVFRIALSYFFLALTPSVLFSWAIYKYQQQQQQQHGLTATQAELVLVSLQTVVGAVFARHVVVAHDLPRVPWLRLAVGGLAAAFLAGAEAILWLMLYEEGYGGQVWEADGSWLIAVLVGLGVFAAMPAALMAVEREGRAPAIEKQRRADEKGGV